MKQKGFTLVEIAIVLVIIGLLLGGILASQSIISGAKAKDVIAIVGDLRTATAYFKQRYSYLPGDLPNPQNYITTVPVLAAGTGGNIGDGSIDGAVNGATGQATAGSEVAQAPWQLYNAGLIGTINSSDPTRYLKTTFGAVQIVSQATANLLVQGGYPTVPGPGVATGFTTANPAARNAIVFFNLPCDVANEVDLKLDDGNLGTGNGQGSAACAGSNTLPVYAIPL